MSIPRKIVLVLAVAYLVVQMTVPALALLGSRPGRFGWQMYSALPSVPRAWTVDSDGTERPVDLLRLLAVQRSEIDYRAVLAQGLCDVSDAVVIKVQRGDGTETETIACR